MKFKTIRLAAISLALAAGQIAAHDLRLSSIDVSDGPSGAAIVVSIPLSELALAERGQRTAALTPFEIDAAIRRRLNLQPVTSSVSIDSAADLLTWRAAILTHAADLVIESRLIPELPLTYTRVRTIGENGRSHEVWLGTPAPRRDSSIAQTLLNFLRMGFAHVLDGPDHIAFILGLILLGGSLRSLVGTVTAFTVAHSITLGLAAARIVAPSPRLIEPLIALSIVAIAAENLVRRGSLSRRPYYAFAFGLVHGFGLAGPLREMAPSGAWFGLSLVPFNLGVELAQAAIVLAVWPPLRWLARRSPAALSRVAFAGSCAIGMAGAYWFADRVNPSDVAFAQGAESADSVAERVEASFRPFAPHIATHHDAQFFYVESDGMPDHRMMVGITAWQQRCLFRSLIEAKMPGGFLSSPGPQPRLCPRRNTSFEAPSRSPPTESPSSIPSRTMATPIPSLPANWMNSADTADAPTITITIRPPYIFKRRSAPPCRSRTHWMAIRFMASRIPMAQPRATSMPSTDTQPMAGIITTPPKLIPI